MAHDKAAFHWIVGELRKHRIPFQVTGGLAARSYGSDRPLADIDLDIAEPHLELIHRFVAPFTVFGPGHFIDSSWDLQLLTLEYDGQAIDLGGAYEAKIFDRILGKWIKSVANFDTAEQREIFGIHVPVINRQDLINYKSKLARACDLEDVHAIQVLS